MIMWQCERCGYFTYREEKPYGCPKCHTGREMISSMKEDIEQALASWEREKREFWALFSNKLSIFGYDPEIWKNNYGDDLDDWFESWRLGKILSWNEYIFQDEREFFEYFQPKKIEKLSEEEKRFLEKIYRRRIPLILGYSKYELERIFGINGYDMYENFDSYHGIIAVLMFVRETFKSHGNIWVRTREYATPNLGTKVEASVNFHLDSDEVESITAAMKSLGFGDNTVSWYQEIVYDNKVHRQAPIKIYRYNRVTPNSRRCMVQFPGVDRVLRFINVVRPEVNKKKIELLKLDRTLWDNRIIDPFSSLL